MTLSSIRMRIALLTGGLLALIFVGLGAFLYSSLSHQLHQMLDDNLRLSAEQLTAMLESNQDEWQFEGTDMGANPVSRLVSPDGSLLDDRSLLQVPIPAETIRGRGGFFTVAYNDSIDEEQNDEELDDYVRLLSVPLSTGGDTIVYLQIGRDLETVQETLRRLLILLLVSGPVVVLLGGAIGYWLAGQTLAPIDVIRRRAASISAEDLSARIDMPLPDDEVGQLALTFNEMLDRLEAGFRRQRQFTADASHELRTPLSVIRGETDVTLDQPRTAAEYQRTLRSIDAEAEWMTRLINDLLLLARSDSAELALDRTSVDLADLLTVLIQQMQPQAEAAGVEMEIDLPSPLPIYGDPDRLLQVFINLLINAFSYAPESQLIVEGRMAGNMVEIRVSDTGPGIAPEHVPHLFERFYRVDQACSRASGARIGSGLGLAIAQEIVRAHGGEIRVESEVGVGTSFIVRIPQDE